MRRALDAELHVGALVASAVGRPPKTIGPVAPSSSGIATIIVASTGIRPRSEALQCFERLELERLGGEIGHVEPRQHRVGRAGVVIGGAADQREAGQRDQRVDDRRAVALEEGLDRGARVEPAGEGRDDVEARAPRAPR